MAGKLEGITIEFRGDATPLNKALRQVNSEAFKAQQELSKINTALKFNPTSVDLWKQKQDVLNKRIKATDEELNVLRQTQEKMDAAGVEKNSEEYRRVQRAIIEAESKLKTFKAQLRQVGNVKLKAVSEQFKKVGTSLKSAGQSLRGLSTAAAGVTASIGALAYKSGKWADDLNTMSKQYGIATEELQKYSAAADLVDVSTEAIANSHLKLERTMYSASKGSKSTAEAFEQLGVSVTNSDGSLRDSDEVFTDVISALGTMQNQTERDALAMKLMGKSASELNPLILDGGETYKQVAETMKKYNLEFVDQETLDNANKFNDSLDTIKMIGLTTFQNLGAQLAEYLAPALEKIVDYVGRFANWLSQLSPRTQAIIAVISALVAGLAPLLIIVGTIATLIGNIIGLVGVIGPVIAGIAGPIGIAILVIGLLIAAGIALYKNWDRIKAWAKSLKETLINTFNNLKTRVKAIFMAVASAMLAPIQRVASVIKAIVDRIKGFFTGFKIRIPHVPLPHFSITPKGWKIGDLLKGKIPKLGINWYATGGIFESPSIIGVGESGSEAVVPLDKLWKQLDSINGGTEIVINVYPPQGASVEAIAREVERKLINSQKRNKLAWQ